VKPEEAEGRFRALLAEAGVDLDGPFEPDTVRRAWEAFKRFAAEPVDGMSPEDDSDMLLVQAGDNGMYEPSFSLGLLRQFIHQDDDGEDGEMEQIECSFEFGDVPELEETPSFRGAADGGHLPVAADLRSDEL
jgi:hypothetical protein